MDGGAPVIYEAADGPIRVEDMTLMHLHAAIRYARETGHCREVLPAMVERARKLEASIKPDEHHPNPFLWRERT